MLTFVGDVHGWYAVFERLHTRHHLTTPVIQVGDLGFTRKIRTDWPKGLGFDTYAIAGNHENHRWLEQFTEVTEVAERLFFVPRGTVMELEGHRIGFMGGAESVDVAYRTPGVDWWPGERITEEEQQRLFNLQHPLDLLVTHSPPSEVIPLVVGLIDRKSWGLPADWQDISSQRIQQLWEHHNRIPLVCGHLHSGKQVGTCRVLGIDECWEYSV